MLGGETWAREGGGGWSTATPTRRLPRCGTVQITCRGDTGHWVVFITKPLPCRWEKSLSEFTPHLPTVFPVLLHGLMLKMLICFFK